MAVAQFAREYRTVRRSEGWGSEDGAYYRALPYHDLTSRFSAIWRIRAKSYDTFLREVLAPLERGRQRLTVLDLGAGNGWLAYRLALRGHSVVAVDILDDRLDGLGAARHYDGAVGAVLAAFDQLPLGPDLADLVVFNASLHYATRYETVLHESLRVLKQSGTLVILDSPMYSDPTSGARMVQEREARFLATYGFKSNALPSEHFLTPGRLRDVGHQLGLKWRVHQPALDWQTGLERTVAGLRARREPAQFPVIAGTRQ